MSNKTFRMDGYMSAVLGGREFGQARLASVSAPYLYAKGGVFARICDKPAADALSGSLKLENDNGTLSTEWERLNVIAHLTDAVRWTRLTGGAVLMPIVADNQSLDMPLGSYAQIEEWRVYAADQVHAYGTPYNDPSQVHFGQPELLQINTRGGSFIVHESRLIFMRGDALPPSLTQSAWQGRDAVTAAYRSLLELTSAMMRVGQILERKQQPIYAMLGLADMIQHGFEDKVQKQINMVDMARGILNTVAVDKEDSYTIADLNLSGLPEIVDVYKEQIAADSGLPISLLFGRSAAGLNATGEGDLRHYYDMVDGIRTKQVKPALERVTAMIAAQGHLKNVVDDWRIVFPPLWEPTAKETAEVAKIQAETLQIQLNALMQAAQTGAISEREAHDYLRREGLFGLSEHSPDDAKDYLNNMAT